MDTAETGMVSRRMALEEGWIDYNGHLNMAYYNVLFDRGMDDLFEALGFGAHYQSTRGLTTYAAEAHVRYLREVHLGDIVRVGTRILDHDAKRLHTFAWLLHADGWVSATCETMTLHVDQRAEGGPKVAAMPEDIMANVERLAGEHASLPPVEGVGRPIGIRRG